MLITVKAMKGHFRDTHMAQEELVFCEANGSSWNEQQEDTEVEDLPKLMEQVRLNGLKVFDILATWL